MDPGVLIHCVADMVFVVNYLHELGHSLKPGPEDRDIKATQRL